VRVEVEVRSRRCRRRDRAVVLRLVVVAEYDERGRERSVVELRREYVDVVTGELIDAAWLADDGTTRSVSEDSVIQRVNAQNVSGAKGTTAHAAPARDMAAAGEGRAIDAEASTPRSPLRARRRRPVHRP